MAETLTPVEIFCSYAHADEAWLRKMEIHLSLLKHQGRISLWHDRLIAPGTNWAQIIDTRLETASVILLLVSADFFASDYCYGIEMKRALERQEAGAARVIPILVRQVDWKNTPFAHLQILPTDAKPLASWKDKDAALADVVAGICRVIENLPLLSVSAPRVALPAIWNIPYSRNPFFVGRATELAQVYHHLQAGQATALSQPQAISGLGGIGKTQLAVEYAYQYHQNYQAVLWARAESKEVMVSSYAAIARLLRLPECEAEEQEVIVQAVKRWLQAHRGWLLILDNADELTVLPDFLPPTLGGHLLLTTRAAATGRLAYRLEIEVLLPEQGALFLLKRAALLAPNATLEQVSSQEQELAMQITQELGGLPLALDQAGAYLEETGCSLGTYLNLFHTHRIELLKRTSNVHSDHPQSIATTLFLSFQQVEQTSPVATNMLHLFAFLDPDTISEAIIVEGTSESSFLSTPFPTDAFTLNEAIEALRKLSLVKRLSEKGLISVHRLVQAIIKEEMDEETRERWAKQAVIMVNKAFPDIYKISWLQRQYYLPQARACRSLILHHGFSSVEAAQLLYKAAGYMMSSGTYDEEAEQLLQGAHSIFEKVLGPTHVSTLNTLSRQARLYDGLKKFELSEGLWQHLVSTYENLKGSEHPTVAKYLGRLAQSYRYQDRLDLAEQFSLRALAMRENALGDSDYDTADELLGLAMIYRVQGKHEKAEPLYLRALAISESTLGAEDRYTAICLYVLATCYLEQSKYEAAEPLFQRSLTIHEKVQDTDYASIARILEWLADIYDRQGKNELADSLYQRSITAHEKDCENARGSSSVADCLEEYAIFVRRKKQDKYAAALESRVKVIRSQTKS